MSREINNSEYRQKVIKELLNELHNGKSAEDVKARFQEAFDGVSAIEISEAEQALIAEGLPVEEVQKLCDVHAAAFKGILKEEELPTDFSLVPGHPAHTLKEENRALERLIESELNPALENFTASSSKESLEALRHALKKLMSVNLHYLKKENLMFPYMEQHGITAPPKVMWGVDDEIRNTIKQAIERANSAEVDSAKLIAIVVEATTKITEMIFKEENILIPMLMNTFVLNEWKSIADESGDLGYCLIETPPVWSHPESASLDPVSEIAHQPVGSIIFPTGVMQIKELIFLLDALPIDITFVDKDDTVKYFSQGAERVFPRTKAIIGRKVVNCHPPASMHIVEGILADFKSGKKTHEDFWIRMGGKLIYIRYFAVRDEAGDFLGTLEVTQNIAPIQEITGEKRLVSAEE